MAGLVKQKPSREMRAYLVREGKVHHHYNEETNEITRLEGGETVMLTERQARAFKDKVTDPEAEMARLQKQLAQTQAAMSKAGKAGKKLPEPEAPSSSNPPASTPGLEQDRKAHTPQHDEPLKAVDPIPEATPPADKAEQEKQAKPKK